MWYLAENSSTYKFLWVLPNLRNITPTTIDLISEKDYFQRAKHFESLSHNLLFQTKQIVSVNILRK